QKTATKTVYFYSVKIFYCIDSKQLGHKRPIKFTHHSITKYPAALPLNLILVNYLAINTTTHNRSA
ncbi:hypothetical protein, partial [Pseudoalteromonas sp. SG45-6]|uniref:hypothetical protein n=1 Tax=Pseudoalteromonas sp. SG45-6 TaxID=2760953 RepID=UPI001C729BD1